GLGALGGTAWYAAGIAPGLTATDRTWRAARLADANTDGIPDGLPGEVAVIPVEASRARTLDYLVPAMARVGLDRDAQHLELSLIGHAARDSRFLGNATLPAAGIDRTTLVGDAIATWRGSWAQTHARVQLSWHHSARRDSAHDPAAAHLPQLLTAFVPQTLADDPQLAAVCDDTSPDDPTRLIANCPVPSGLFASGGAGLLTRAIGDRPTATADIAHQVGGHVLRAGATFEDTRLVTTSSFTGDQEQFALFPGELSRRRFYVGDCTDEPATAPCDYASRSQLTYRTVYAAAFAEDTFAPQRGLSIDGGLRWELMWVGTRLRFSHELAPRVGIAWDVLGDGRSRVWANLGKTFAMLPAGLGPTVIQRDAIADDFELGGLVSRRHDTGAAVQVVPGTEPIEQDEITFGGELALVGALRATVWGQGRFIRRGLETTPGGFDNPGRNGDVPATRQSELIAFALEMMQRERTSIRAGVSWGRVDGTWTGPYDPRQGANLLAGSDWDVDASNLFGPLPTSPGSRVFVEAERRGRLGAVDAWVATRLEAGSGRPRNALADGPEGVVELLPRGALGNGPVLAQTDLRLAARWRGFTATLELVNVFDRREPTNLDEIYTGDAVRPIEGGSYADLVFLKTDAGTPASRRTAFQLPTAFQDPMQITLGVHRTF
ncbi:MAG TPA: hypothetical protein VFT22_07850, partial [Kofleriaceae bacterium]|nr:hypothetical protein [Kofleriaceae bacterium]